MPSVNKNSCQRNQVYAPESNTRPSHSIPYQDSGGDNSAQADQKAIMYSQPLIPCSALHDCLFKVSAVPRLFLGHRNDSICSSGQNDIILAKYFRCRKGP